MPTAIMPGQGETEVTREPVDIIQTFIVVNNLRKNTLKRPRCQAGVTAAGVRFVVSLDSLDASLSRMVLEKIAMLVKCQESAPPACWPPSLACLCRENV